MVLNKGLKTLLVPVTVGPFIYNLMSGPTYVQFSSMAKQDTQ